MKRIVAGLVIFTILLIAAILIFIPARPAANGSTRVIAPVRAVTRNLTDETRWMNWWPDKTLASTDKFKGLARFKYQGKDFILIDKLMTSLVFTVQDDSWVASSRLDFEVLHPDTTLINWKFEFPPSNNPITRVLNSIRSRRLSADADFLLAEMNSFYSKEQNLYGADINMELLADSMLVSTFAVQDHRPTTSEIYGLIDKLHAHVAMNKAVETGSPMLNVSPAKDSFIVRVAIPVDRKLPPKEDISFKRMPAGVKILSVDIVGGSAKTEQVMREVENFASDYSYAAPAIPFFTLITDRRSEPDSNKWKTRITYPVMSGIREK